MIVQQTMSNLSDNGIKHDASAIVEIDPHQCATLVIRPDEGCFRQPVR